MYSIVFYWLTEISTQAKCSMSRVFSLLIGPGLFFVHCPYKGRNNTAKGVLTGPRPYYTCRSILLATFNYRVRGTCVPTRAFDARITR